MDEGRKGSSTSYRFPKNLDLGTSYGSYLASPKTTSVPTLPKITSPRNEEGPTPTVKSLYTNLQVLVESLNTVCTQVKTRGCNLHQLHSTYISLATAMSDLEPVLHHLDRSHDSHMTEKTLHVMIIYVMTIIQALIGSVDAMLTSCDSRVAIHKQTRAELCAVKNCSNKLSQKLKSMEEINATLKQEIGTTRHLLKVTTKELENERLKLQSVKLAAQHNKRELVNVQKSQPNAKQKSLEKEVHSLQQELEQRSKIERQLRRRIHDDGLKIKQLQSQTNSKRKKEIEQAYTTKRHRHKAHPNTSTSQLSSIKKPHPSQYSPTELLSLAKFTDHAAAMETMNLLDKQGFLN